MDVDHVNPTSSDSAHIQTDSIDIYTEHLERPALLNNLIAKVKINRFVLLTSPPASGKSSLLKLYQHKSKEYQTKIIWITCLDVRSCEELLLCKGIDMQNHKIIAGKIPKLKNTVVFLDDAQEKYDDIIFWRNLIKF